MIVYVVYGYEVDTEIEPDYNPEVVRIFNSLQSANDFVDKYKSKWENLTVSEWDVEP